MLNAQCHSLPAAPEPPVWSGAQLRRGAPLKFPEIPESRSDSRAGYAQAELEVG
jgi:hypothetical protein